MPHGETPPMPGLAVHSWSASPVSRSSDHPAWRLAIPDVSLSPRADTLGSGPAEAEPMSQLHIHDDVADASPAADEEQEPNTIVMCGRAVHLSLVRPYHVPHDVAWDAVDFGFSLWSVYRDPAVAAEFRAFFYRTMMPAFVGQTYGPGMLLVNWLGVVSPAYRWVGTAGGLLAAGIGAVDSTLHTSVPGTRGVARVRMLLSHALCAAVVLAAAVTAFPSQARCDEARDLSFAGRIAVSGAERRALCVQGVESFQVSTIMAGTLGCSLLPVPHVALLALNAVLGFVPGRLIADAGEPWGELLMKLLVVLVASAGSAAIMVFRLRTAMAAFESTVGIERQRREAAQRAAELQRLLATMVPAAVLPRLVDGGAAQFAVDYAAGASVLFADMRGFTAWAAARPAAQVAAMMNVVVAAVDRLVWAAGGVEKVKTVGDAYWAVAGLPVPAEDHADQLVGLGWDINAAVAALRGQHAEWGDVAFRVAVHSGPLAGALFGQRQVSYEVFGDTSRVAQLVEANGVPGALCVTPAVLAALLLAPDPSQVRPVATVLDRATGRPVEVLLLRRVDTDLSSTMSRNERLAAVTAAASLPAASVASSVVGASDGVSDSTGVASTALPTVTSVVPSSCGVIRPFVPPPPRKHQGPGSARVELRLPIEALEEDRGLAFDEAAVAEAGRPRWRFLPWFADEAMEAAFKARAETATRGMHRCNAAACLALHVTVLAAGFVQEGRCWHVPGLVLQLVALVLYAAAVAIAVHPRWPLQAATWALVAAVLFGTNGTGLTSFGGCHFGDDLMYYASVTALCLTLCVGPVSWPILAGVVSLVSVTPLLLFGLFRSPLPFIVLLMAPMGAAFGALLAWVEEGLQRRRFVEEHLSLRGEERLGHLAAERVAVLERLVPAHVVQDLVAWFGTGMDPQRAVAREYGRVVVAFMRLLPPDLGALPRLHADVDDDLERCNGEHGAGAGATLLDKIKTVGDVVMLAGPFEAPSAACGDDGDGPCPGATYCEGGSGCDVAAALATLVSVVGAVRRRCDVRVGAHIGPVAGTVQGSSRLAFDVFGDAVNVASRVMEHAPPKALLNVSRDVRDSLSDTAWCSLGVGFQEGLYVETKGKGRLEVFPVADIDVPLSIADT